MTRKDLVIRLAERMQMDPDAVRAYFDAFLDVIVDILGKGERIEIRGFGIFQIQERSPEKHGIPGAVKKSWSGRSVLFDSKWARNCANVCAKRAGSGN